MNYTLERLKPLIRELQELPDWPMTETLAALLLYDVLSVFEVSMAELEQTLGEEAMILIEGVSRQDAEQTPPSPLC